MFLAATALTDFWHPADELLALGPWCLRYDSRPDWEKRAYRVLPNPWADRDRFHGAAAYCDEVSERLLGRLADWLDAAHGTSYGKRYWRVLIGLWLAYHVGKMYDHYVHVCDALEAYPDLGAVRLDPRDYLTPAGFDDFIRLSTADPSHLQHYSFFLDALRPGYPMRRLKTEAAPPPAPRRNARLKLALKGAAGAAARALRGLGRGDILAADLYIDRRQELALYRKSGLRVLPYQPPAAPPSPALRPESRRGLAALPAAEGFERLLVRSLPYDLPVSALEAYPAAREAALRGLAGGPKAVVSSVGWYGNEPFKLLAAECSARGGHLLGIQHGMGYGITRPLCTEAHERAVVDRFYTWGWSRLHDDPRLSFLPNPKVSATVKPRRGADQVLLVLTSEPMHTIRMVRGPIGTQGWDYLEWQARFIAALPAEARSRLLIRAYDMDTGWDQAARLRARFRGLRFDDGSASFEERLKDAGLVVVDHPGTTLAQAVSAGVPTTAYWDAAYWETRPEAEPTLKALRDGRILHATPESAAAMASAPRGWWDEPKTAAARAEFRRVYADGGPGWLEAWAAELVRAAV